MGEARSRRVAQVGCPWRPALISRVDRMTVWLLRVGVFNKRCTCTLRRPRTTVLAGSPARVVYSSLTGLPLARAASLKGRQLGALAVVPSTTPLPPLTLFPNTPLTHSLINNVVWRQGCWRQGRKDRRRGRQEVVVALGQGRTPVPRRSYPPSPEEGQLRPARGCRCPRLPRRRPRVYVPNLQSHLRPRLLSLTCFPPCAPSRPLGRDPRARR
jgi:hypothetical protein